MTQQYTIHKFTRTKFYDAPFNSLTVEETGYDGLYPEGLLHACTVLAHQYIKENPGIDYNLVATVRGVSDDPKDIFEGKYPGIELREKNMGQYAIAWVVVPLLDENGNYDRSL